MKEYIVNFEKNGENHVVNVMANSPEKAKFNAMNANGKIDYFNSVLINDIEEDE